ncbi:hypothetical protein [Castellaniella sp.]|uniref:hypothetical protein n=1 Tax=Castellaniella sp. TaxID=1955812 RepID=UPI002AFFC392|nr:hypothetical protein [Castellaniella sp.]
MKKTTKLLIMNAACFAVRCAFVLAGAGTVAKEVMPVSAGWRWVVVYGALLAVYALAAIGDWVSDYAYKREKGL